MAAATKFSSKPRASAAEPHATPAALAAPKDLPTHALSGVIAAAAIGAAIQNGNGMLHGDAIEWLTLGVIATAFGIVAPRTPALQQVAAKCLPFAAMAGIVYAFYMWPFTRPALYVQGQSPLMSVVYRLGLGAAAVLAGLSLNPPKWLSRLHLPALLCVYAFLGHWVLQSSPSPHVDVLEFHKDAIAALLHGQNPFAIDFPNIYHPDASNYPDGTVSQGRLLFGYMYPPINLLMALPGYVFGDYRYALLAANLVSGYLIGRMDGWSGHRTDEESPRLGLAFAALFLFTPRALLVLENGWIEPFTILFLTGTIYASLKKPQWVPYALGLLIASKQYVVLLMASAYNLPQLTGQLHDRKALLDFWGRALGTAAVVTLPFFLWSPAAFWHSVVTVPASHPFRADALDFPAWYRQTEGTLLPTWLGFLAAALTSFATYKWMPRTLAGFAYSFGAIFLFFIAFNRQAFCNYYFLIIAAFCAAAALGATQGNASPAWAKKR